MTETAELMVQAIKLLPQPELRELWKRVGKLVVQPDAPPIVPVPERSPEEFHATLDALTGCTQGSGLLKALLNERAREREHEASQLDTRLNSRRRA